MTCKCLEKDEGFTLIQRGSELYIRLSNRIQLFPQALLKAHLAFMVCDRFCVYVKASVMPLA
jgi:hypothetical protein